MAEILIVDDNDLLRRHTRMALATEGIEALEAASGEECLALLERSDHGVLIILLDLVMPGMDGVDTYRRLRAKHPQLWVIFISGLVQEDEEELQELILRDPRASFLRKPLTPDQIHRTVKEALLRAMTEVP